MGWGLRAQNPTPHGGAREAHHSSVRGRRAAWERGTRVVPGDSSCLGAREQSYPRESSLIGEEIWPYTENQTE